MFKRFKNLTPVSVTALAVVTATSFLMLCVLFGGGRFGDLKAPRSAGFVGALVETCGAGLWVMLLLPCIWAVIVYFDERTPDLLMRAVGTIVLAVSTSTLVALCHGESSAGHVGTATARALAGSSGGLRTVLAWTIDVALLFASFVFATDWAFHSLRRAGRAAPAGASVVADAAVVELRDETTSAEPREFVAQTPRAAVAAAALDEVSAPSPDEAFTPEGWDEHEDDGRTVISAPSGYRGVEFLPPSDELAVPETLQAPRYEVEEAPTPAEPVAEATPFEDQHFVTTDGAAYFVEPASDEASDNETPADEATVADAVQTLFEAVTTPEDAPAAPSGIGLPDDSPFLDEFFATDAGWPYAAEPVPEPIARRASPPASAPAPEPVESAPAFEDEMVSIDDVLVSRLPADAFDDVPPLAEQTIPESVPATMPAAPAVEAAPPAAVVAEAPTVEFVPEPAAAETVAAPVDAAPQLPLFPETSPAPVATTSPSAPTSVDLSRLHAMELDPLFHDAVAAVLERDRASAVVLQRQLGIGYARGIRILDQMTNAGLVGPDTPTGSREIRVSKDAWAAVAAG